MDPLSPAVHDDNTIIQPSPMPLSEMGSGPDFQWRAMFELQQKTMTQLVEAIKTLASSPELVLPVINPDLPDSDLRAWCATVDVCLNEQPLEGASLVVALSRALKGSASLWLSQVTHVGMTWKIFRDLFLARYDSRETLAATLIGINNDTPKDGECLTAYAGRLLTSLLTRWKDLNQEEIATAYVMAHISQFDSRLYRMAFTSDIQTRGKLLQEVKASVSGKRSFNQYNRQVGRFDAPDAKRLKLQSFTTFKCYKCGVPSHKAIDCRRFMLNKPTTNAACRGKFTTTVTAATSNQVICFRCGVKGHVATKCRRGNTGGATSQYGIQQRGHHGSPAMRRQL